MHQKMWLACVFERRHADQGLGGVVEACAQPSASMSDYAEEAGSRHGHTLGDELF